MHAVSIPLLLEETLLQVRRVYESPRLVWKNDKATEDDIMQLRKEAADGLQFDTNGLKASVVSQYDSGSVQLHCKVCALGRVVALLPGGSAIPTDLWGRIFQLFGHSEHGPRWNIYWFGSGAKREFPEKLAAVEAAHLNGGYTTACSTHGIFIYRLEEATRVLIHELMHAACLDPVGTIPEREATVETWAEVILVALKAKGRHESARRLWNLQTQWVADTNEKAARDHNVVGQDDYAWRYMNGRADVYKNLGLQIPKPSGKFLTSSRFTHEELGD